MAVAVLLSAGNMSVLTHAPACSHTHTHTHTHVLSLSLTHTHTHPHQVQAAGRQQAEESAAAVAVLLSAGNGLDERLRQAVTAEEAMELDELHRLVQMRQVGVLAARMGHP